MEFPKITVITIVYNDHKGLEMTANSVISQTSLSSMEWIVIDAGSKDGTIDVFERYKKYMSHAISEPDRGRYDGMNKGIKLANGEYIIFMNAGDVFSDEHVIENITKLNFFGASDYISGNTIGIKANKIVGKHFSPTTITAKFFFTDSLCHQSTFIKTERLKMNGGYDLEYKITADAKFFFEDIILRNASYSKVDFYISKYDISGYSSTNQKTAQQEKKLFISKLLPPRICKDIDRLAYGGTTFERILINLGHKGFIYNIISLFSFILYSPISITNRIKIFFRKHYKK